MTGVIAFSTIPRLFTALAEWCSCLMVIKLHPQRRSGRWLWGILAAGLVAQSVFLQLTGSLPLGFWLPCMAVAVGGMLLMISLCLDGSLRYAAYLTVSAFLLAEFAASLEWQLYCFLAPLIPQGGWVLFWCCLLAVYGILFPLVYLVGQRHATPASAMTLKPLELWPPVLIGLSCFVLSNLSFVTDNTPFTSDITEEVYNIRTLVDFAGVATLYAYHFQRCEGLAQQEISAIQNALTKQYEQYCLSRENIDLINRKYHDLKHQLAVLRAEPSQEKRTAYLDQMEESLQGYACQYHTGNPVLDTVLTGKAMQCAARQIQFTANVDGSLLHFLGGMELCTIFGNVLDNAIEAEEGVTDPQQRVILLTVQRKKQFVVIQCENYAPQPPRFREGLPVTTKGDRGYHGFGVKSIRYTAEQYGGSLAVNWQDGWFHLTVLLPAHGQTE